MKRIPAKRISAILFLSLLFAQPSFLACAQKTADKPQAEILWDTWGVPHIFAKDDASAFHAFGWAQMQSHGNLLLKLMAEARGRSAELYGDEALATDLTVRTLGLYETAGQWYRQQTPDFRRNIDAFAAGINEYARAHPEKISALERSVLPVTGVDIVAHTTRVLIDFVSKPCASALPRGNAMGSNGWAIGPAHSADGHAMLLVNPHLPWGGEYTEYEARISTPDYHFYGAALVGIPVLSFGFNNLHGWTHTVNTIDACDVYALTAGQDSNEYVFDGQTRTLSSEAQTICVRLPDGSIREEPFVRRTSALGPVVEKDGKLFAIRIAGLQAAPFPGALEEWWKMGQADNLSQFQAALRRMQLPMFNVIYADHAGHIELLFDGLVPDRLSSNLPFAHGVLPGDRSTLVWTKVYPFADLPSAVDPPAGWVENSNSAPWYMTSPLLDPKKYPADIAPQWNVRAGEPSPREQRGLHMLQQQPKLSFDALLADKYSTRSELADRLLDDLLSAAGSSMDAQVRQGAGILRSWDRTMDAESRGGPLFEAWYRAYMHYMRGDIYAQAFDVNRPYDTPTGLKDPQAAVAALKDVVNHLQQGPGGPDAAWGEMHHFHRGSFDLPSNGGPGNLGIFRVIQYAPAQNGPAIADFGDTFFAAIDFTSPLKAKVLLSYGNSGDPASPHFGDQLPLAAQKAWRDPWLSRSDIEKHLEDRKLFFK